MASPYPQLRLPCLQKSSQTNVVGQGFLLVTLEQMLLDSFRVVIPRVWDCASLDPPVGRMPYQYQFSALLHFWVQVCFQCYLIPTNQVQTFPCLSLDIYTCMKYCSGYKCVRKLTLLSLEIQINQLSKSFILSYMYIFCETFLEQIPKWIPHE